MQKKLGLKIQTYALEENLFKQLAVFSFIFEAENLAYQQWIFLRTEELHHNSSIINFLFVFMYLTQY